MTSENIVSADGSYILRAPKIQSAFNWFYSKNSRCTEIAFFYGEGIGGDDGGDEDTFVSEIVTGIDKQNMGAELGLEYQITSTIKSYCSCILWTIYLFRQCKIKTNDDALAAAGRNSLTDFGTVYIKDYHQPGMPHKQLLHLV